MSSFLPSLLNLIRNYLFVTLSEVTQQVLVLGGLHPDYGAKAATSSMEHYYLDNADMNRFSEQTLDTPRMHTSASSCPMAAF